jgi:hypothetical protein
MSPGLEIASGAAHIPNNPLRWLGGSPSWCLKAKRWLLGPDSYGSDLSNYRRYLVNDEFGHVLGKHHVGVNHHVDCPRPGWASASAADQGDPGLSEEPLAASPR